MIVSSPPTPPRSSPPSTAPRSSAPTTDPPALLALLSFHKNIRTALRSLEELAAPSASSGGGSGGSGSGSGSGGSGRGGSGDGGSGRGGDDARAATLHDFLRGPMRWHDDDESRSLLPRLLAADRSIASALTACADEHARIEGILDVVLVHLRDIGVGAAVPDAVLLTNTAWQLRTLLEPHLRREEQELFPRARAVLSAADFDAIASEVRVRRLRRLHDLAESDVLSW